MPPAASASYRSRSAGFTLLELLAVIGVIAILTGLVIGVGRRVTENGRVSRARAELAVLTTALDAYRAARGDYPRTNDSARLLQSLIGRRGPDGAATNGPALIGLTAFTTQGDPFTDESALLLDPWEQPYRYAYKVEAGWTNPWFILASAGPDGTGTPTLRPGGYPEIAAPGNADNLYAVP